MFVISEMEKKLFLFSEFTWFGWNIFNCYVGYQKIRQKMFCNLFFWGFELLFVWRLNDLIMFILCSNQ